MMFSKKLALENGLLTLIHSSLTNMAPDSANDMAFYYLPVKYDPEADLPKL